MYSIGLETKCVCLFVCVRMRHLCTDESSILYAFRVKISFNIARIQVSFAHFILLCFMHTVFSCLCSNEEKKHDINNKDNNNTNRSLLLRIRNVMTVIWNTILNLMYHSQQCVRCVHVAAVVKLCSAENEMK